MHSALGSSFQKGDGLGALTGARGAAFNAVSPSP